MGLFVSFYSQTVLPSGLTSLSTENYVFSRTYLDGTTTSNTGTKQIQSVTYFDGLGRAKQSIAIKASPLGKDIVSHIEYDDFGRQRKDYLPIPQSATANGAIYTSPLANVATIYGGEKIYAEKILEASPLNRIQQQIQVGNDWATHPVQFGYDANTANEVKKYTATTTWANNATTSTITINGDYLVNQLYKNTVTDEDLNVSTEFKNGQGQTILVRKNNGTQNVDTYYIYNEYDQLVFVLSPKASESYKNLATGAIINEVDTILNNLCYQYRYDDRNRLVEKKLPGKGWEYLVYDQADRLIMTQDANQRVNGTWLFTKYDQFGRVAFTGITLGNANSTRTIEQTAANSISINNVMRTANAVINYSSLDLYYTVADTYPHYTNISHLLSVNYYDTYPPIPSTLTIPTNIIGQNVLTQDAIGSPISTKSLPTASFVKNIEDNGWTKAYTWYDTKGRPIGSYSLNHLGGFTKTESELDFAGVVKQSNTTHKKLDTDSPTLVHEEFTYDNQNRMLTHKHKVGNNPLETLSTNTYNELSQINQKGVGGSTGIPLQTVDYTYNIRGWMTGINDPTNLGADLFGYKIKYNQVEGLQIPDASDNTLKVLPKYNGNIAEVDWKTSLWENEPLERYGYVYDNTNRLTAGFYQKSTNPSIASYFEKVGYDLNGNIITLKRSAENYGPIAMIIDDLTYQYESNESSNRIKKITDASQNFKGYPYASTPTDIGYDNNGNITAFPDKGISSITYNFLNLPSAFVHGNATSNITYRADGAKLKKVFSGMETYYLDGFQYSYTDSIDDPTGTMVNSETILRMIPTSEGYFDPLLNKYFYNFTDHLGNVRLTYSDDDGNGSVAGNTRVTQCYGTFPNIFCTDYFVGGEITLVNKYYPFGLLHNYQYDYSSVNQYKYNGKELQETGMYDYGARFYMSDIGRWGVVDPLAEKYPSWSPYNFCYNNPIRFTDFTGMGVDNEYDSNGKMISNLGGNKVDFFHQKNGDTQVVNRQNGASNVIKGGESIIRGYAHRGKDVGWGTITNEYINGTGPTRSLFSDFNNSNNGPFASLDKTSSPYSSLARQDALNSENSKGVIKMDYLHANPLRANLDMYEQMWGRSNMSWYKLGDETLFLMTDSKSQQSLFYRIPSIDNFERSSNFKFNGLGNTYQTYIWTESNSEVQQKVYNLFDPKKNQPINNATRQQINDYIKNGGAP